MIRAHDLGVRGIDNIARSAVALGLDGVQLVAYKSLDEVSYKKGSITKEIAENVKETLQKHSLSIPLLGAYFNPVHPNSDKAKLGVDVFCDYLDRLGDFGAIAVGSESGSLMGDPWGYHEGNRTDTAFDEATSRFIHLAKYAKNVGACIALEGAYNHVYYSPERLKAAVERIGRDNIKIIFDLYNYLDKSNISDMYGILERGLEIFPEILLFHIKDCTLGEDGTLKQCGVGKGIFDFDKIISMIAKRHPDAILVLEGTVGEDVSFAVAHLREKIARYT